MIPITGLPVMLCHESLYRAVCEYGQRSAKDPTKSKGLIVREVPRSQMVISPYLKAYFSIREVFCLQFAYGQSILIDTWLNTV